MIKNNEKSNKELIGIMALFLSAFFWGGEYVVEKDLLSYIGPNWSNAIRFSVASIACVIFFRDKFKVATLYDWKGGAVTGLLMGLGYALQTMGLKYTDAGINAILTASYAIWIPFVVWLISRKRPNGIIFASSILALTGIGIISIHVIDQSAIRFGLGEVITLFGAVCYAGGIISIGYYTKKINSNLLASMQFIFTAILTFLLAIILEDIPSVLNRTVVFEFSYLILCSSLIAQLLFTYGLKYVEAGKGGIILLSESIMAIAFGWLFLGEIISINQIVGSGLIIFAIFMVDKKDAISC